jgi:hypothetical protein
MPYRRKSRNRFELQNLDGKRRLEGGQVKGGKRKQGGVNGELLTAGGAAAHSLRARSEEEQPNRWVAQRFPWASRPGPCWA